MCPSGGGKTGFFHYLPSCSAADPLSTPSEVPISTLGGSATLLRMFQTPQPSCRACSRYSECNETIHCFHLISSRVPTPVLSCFLLGWLCPGCAVSIGLCGQRKCITSSSQLGVERQLHGHTPVFQASPRPDILLDVTNTQRPPCEDQDYSTNFIGVKSSCPIYCVGGCVGPDILTAYIPAGPDLSGTLVLDTQVKKQFLFGFFILLWKNYLFYL